MHMHNQAQPHNALHLSICVRQTALYLPHAHAHACIQCLLSMPLFNLDAYCVWKCAEGESFEPRGRSVNLEGECFNLYMDSWVFCQHVHVFHGNKSKEMKH